MSGQGGAGSSADEKRRAISALLAARSATQPETVDSFPLSEGQRAIWTLCSCHPESTAYNIGYTVRIAGKLDVERLRDVFAQLIARHAALRTTFRVVGDDLIQSVSTDASMPFDCVSVPDFADHDIRPLISAFIHRSFDLQTGPLTRAMLFQIAPDDCLLVLALHHITHDGWSMWQLLDEIGQLYWGKSVPDTPSPRYSEYVKWQADMLNGPKGHLQLTHMRRILAHAPAGLAFPTDFVRPSVLSGRGAVHSFRIDKDTAERLEKASRRAGATLHSLLLAAYTGALHRFTGQHDLVIGSVLAGSGRSGRFRNTFGYFVNTVPVRSQVSPSTTLGTHFEIIRRAAVDSLRHQDYPLGHVIEALSPRREQGRAPIFQATFALHRPQDKAELGLLLAEDEAAKPIMLGNWQVRAFAMPVSTCRFELSLDVIVTVEGLVVRFTYATDLFRAETIGRLAYIFSELLAELECAPEGPLFSPAARVIAEASDRPEHECGLVEPRLLEGSIAGDIEAKMAEQPEALALIAETCRLTYRDLELRTGNLAARLLKWGVRADKIVGLYLPDPVAMTIAMIATTRIGGAYLPIDSTQPLERSRQIAADAAPHLILASPDVCTEIASLGRVEAFDDSDGYLLNAGVVACDDDLAYVIYTSGSTGSPKGVMVRNRGALNLYRGYVERFELTPGRRNLILSPFTFDLTLKNVFATLMGGATVVLAPPRTIDPDDILRWLTDEDVYLLNCAPSHFGLVKERLLCGALVPELRYAILGGEPIPSYGLEEICRRNPRLLFVNSYGPAEITDVCIDGIVDEFPEGYVTCLGRPIPNATVQVLTEAGEPAAAGEIGELYVGGVGLARGYLGRPEATAARFISCPVTGEPLYRTGDLVRWRDDQRLDYVGRIDQQVKIRGMRVELGEVESVILASPSVAEAAVVMHRSGDVDNESQLTAYVVPVADRCAADDVSVDDWREMWDSTYDSISADEAKLHETVGWQSSYTGIAIPAEEMAEWLDDTVDAILATGPAHVVEVGCGTGMILRRLAPQVQSYRGLDFSEKSIAFLRGRTDIPENVDLEIAAAHESDRFGGQQFDTVVMNSVVQYFPSLTYLDRVISGWIDRLKGGGRLFIGDVRDFRALRLFHASVLASRSGDQITVADWRRAVDEATLAEEELTVDPAWFRALAARFPTVSRVCVQPKRGNYMNELSKFRYDVSVEVGVSKSNGRSPELVCLHGATVVTLKQLREHATDAAAVRIKGLKDARVAEEIAVLRLLEDPNAELGATVTGALIASRAEHSDAPDGFRVGEIAGLHGPAGNSPSIEISEIGFGLLDVTFAAPGDAIGGALGARDGPSAAALANVPRREPWCIDATGVASELRVWVANQLPYHMVPNKIVVCAELPKTSSGKIDRLALTHANSAGKAEPNARTQSGGEGLIAEVASVWCEVLNLTEIAPSDSFFDLGGHSLNAVKAQSRLSDRLGRKLSATLLFRYPTLGALADYLAETSAPVEEASEPDSHTKAFEVDDRAVAIIGMACRVPGATSPEEFWTLLEQGREGISFASKAMLLDAGIAPELIADPAYVPAVPYLPDVDMFDASLFGMSAHEARLTDPQHRVLLECAWETMERAGYGARDGDRRTGVFVGAAMNTYLVNNLIGHVDWTDPLASHQALIGNDKDYLATRLSHRLNLQGPSLSVQTACSTSLVSVHLACQSLRAGHCNMALAGGVSVRVPQQGGYLHRVGSILSPDGHCRPFSADAQGTVMGSGAGLVLLKRLRDALCDGDTIHAVICGSAVLNDGAAKATFAAPGAFGQMATIREALMDAGLTGADISYVEAHGTGTALGDPIEVEALTEVFRESTEERGFCALGSVKSNLGHLDAAAGVIGLIKTVLALGARKIPPTLHFAAPNPKIDFEASPFVVARDLGSWSPRRQRRVAGVSSFGVGGSNAHVIVSEAPTLFERGTDSAGRAEFFCLSAPDSESLMRYAATFRDFLRANQTIELANICYTMAVGRRHFPYRWAAIVSSIEGLVAELDRFCRQQPAADDLFEGELAQTLQQFRAGEMPDLLAAYRDRRPCRVVLPTHPLRRKRYWLDGRADRICDSAEKLTAVHSPSTAAPLPRELGGAILELVARAAGLLVEDVHPDAPFLELSLDSLALVGLRNQLERLLGRPLAGTIFLDNPTPAALCNELLGGQSGTNVDSPAKIADEHVDPSDIDTLVSALRAELRA